MGPSWNLFFLDINGIAIADLSYPASCYNLWHRPVARRHSYAHGPRGDAAQGCVR